MGIKRIDKIFENATVNKYGYETGSDWEGKEYRIIRTDDIIKYSKYLIDLVEVGDYVNGYKVLKVGYDNVYEKGICKYIILLEEKRCFKYYNWDIFHWEILTKEQYEREKYEVEEKVNE